MGPGTSPVGGCLQAGRVDLLGWGMAVKKRTTPTSGQGSSRQHPSGPSLLQAALDDLRAASHLRSQLERSNRPVLKLLDDAAELVLKATLTGNGVSWMRRPFPWLVKACEPFVDVPKDLQSLHALRNSVKHAGTLATPDDVARAYRSVLHLLNRLPSVSGVVYAYCAACKVKIPLFRPFQKSAPRGTPVAWGWCFSHDGGMVGRMGVTLSEEQAKASDSFST